MYDYGYIIVASWVTLMTIWALGAFTAKRDASSGSRVVFWLRSIFLLGILIFALLQNPHGDALILEDRLFGCPVINWSGTFLTVIGITIAIWARYQLGRNWGSHQKEEPVLVINGSYSYVRHPIYFGADLAVWQRIDRQHCGNVLFLISIIFCLRRIKKEERAMLVFSPNNTPPIKPIPKNSYRSCGRV